jgi:hypothetical protein
MNFLRINKGFGNYLVIKLKLICFMFLSYRKHLEWTNRAILINFKVQTKFN